METVAVIGRKANSSSAVDKLKKKKKKKRKIKETKRPSGTGGSTIRTPEPERRLKPQKSRSALSCPPEFSQENSQNSSDGDTEVAFNETLRWLSFIVEHSSALPPVASTSRLHGATASRLNTNSVTETVEEEEERIAIYKMNRRKRYLAAQQRLLELYPDNKVYATDDTSRSEARRLPSKTPIFPTPPTESLDKPNKFELALPSFVARPDKVMAQKVL